MPEAPKPPPQIVDLFEAMKNDMHRFTEQNRERVQADQTSVGDVPAPLVINTQFGKVEVVADPNMREGDAPVFVQTKTPTLEQRIHAIISETVVDGVAIGAKHERAAVVKYLSCVITEHWSPSMRDVVRALAVDIEKGQHLK